MNRRTLLRRTAGAVAAGLSFPYVLRGRVGTSPLGRVVGEPNVEPIGAKVLADGGNAFDAIVATAMAGAVRHPQQCGIGGYCVHGVFSTYGGKRVVTLDANSTAPAAMPADVFKPDAKGNVPDKINEFGWLAAGVPAVMAGLDLVLRELGTRSLAEMAQPAIALARDGFPFPANLAALVKSSSHFTKDPGSRRLFRPGGEPIRAGQCFANPRLAEMLQALATANSVEPFYRGDIAQSIADAFQKHGGLLTAKDLAGYRPRLVEPLTLDWNGYRIHVGPLTAGGMTTLQVLNALKAMRWETLPAAERVHAQIEAMRIAWRDRLALLGDPQHAAVPIARLLGDDYAAGCADEVLSAVRAGRIITHRIAPRELDGTLSFAAIDREGNFAALTITHGNSFGARVTVDDLGLTLGHGMSRFDPHPDHPNAPGPNKRPLHNMAPAIITRDGEPVVAIGGRGGQKIPDTMLEFLLRYVGLGEPFAEALAAPRFHVTGSATVEHESRAKAEDIKGLERLGYTMKQAAPATLSGVAIERGRSIEGMR